MKVNRNQWLCIILVILIGIGICSIPAFAAGQPDLIVTNITWSPANPVPGNEISFSATIKNQGAAASPAGVVHGVSFSVDGTKVSWSAGYNSSISPNQSVTVTANGGPGNKATWKAVFGSHTIQAYVDDANRIAESNETNNTFNKSLNINTQADLIVTDISWSPANPVAGNAITFSATIKNIGTAATPAGVVDGVGFSVDGTKVSWSAGFNSSISPNQSVTVTANGGPNNKATWISVSGNHTVQAYVDDANRIAESNETNNIFNKSINIGTKFLVIVSSPLYQTGLITAALNTYQADLAREGWNVTLIKVNNITDPNANYICPDGPALKSVIRNYYNQGYQGLVFIGSAPAIPTVYWRYNSYSETSPTDLFYADMDDWQDVNSDGYYESYSQTGQFLGAKFAPELFYGRISAGSISTSIQEEATKTADYLNRIHSYRLTGSNLTTTQQNRALFFADDDWRHSKDVAAFYQAVVPEIHGVFDIGLTNPQKLMTELVNGYQYATIINHSYSFEYETISWIEGERWRDYQFNLDLLNTIDAKVNYINLINCSACAFDQANFGATYLFNKSYTYNVTGSTGAWGIYFNADYYKDLANQQPIGIAFKNHLTSLIIGGDESCSKGILLGDPTLRYQKPATANQAPLVTTDFSYLEASAGNLFSLPITAVDPEYDPVTVQITGLPAGATLNNNTLYWTPGFDQAGKTFYLSLTVTDTHNNKYVEDFSIYVSSIKNGLLNSLDGWVISGNPEFSLDWAGSYLTDPIYSMNVSNSMGTLSQSIPVQPNTNYKLIFFIKNDLIQNSSQATFQIDELQKSFYYFSPNMFCYGALYFNSLNLSRITISLHAGTSDYPSTGKVYLTGLRLVPIN